MKNTQIKIKQQDLEKLQAYSVLIDKDVDDMVSEALKIYFDMLEEKLEQEQTSQTNLDFDEFWDGVDI